MQIYALKGHIVQHIKKGINYYRNTKENAEIHLTIGNIYTIDRTEVFRSYTNVYLQGYDNIMFCSTQFIDAIKQPEHWSQAHWDLWYYSGLIRKKRTMT